MELFLSSGKGAGDFYSVGSIKNSNQLMKFSGEGVEDTYSIGSIRKS
jgi:hypothetical protein